MASREEIIERLALASARGQLGLFVGSGFSIGLTAESKERAPNWGQLLERVAGSLGLKMPDPAAVYGTSFPRIATTLIAELREQEREAAECDGDIAETRIDVARRAIWKFKSTVARLCHFESDDHARMRWRNAVQAIDPAWIVTTNYDLMIEDLIPNSSILLPDDLLTIPRGGPVPVFHLHGHRLVPDSLVLKQAIGGRRRRGEADAGRRAQARVRAWRTLPAS